MCFILSFCDSTTPRVLKTKNGASEATRYRVSQGYVTLARPEGFLHPLDGPGMVRVFVDQPTFALLGSLGSPGAAWE